MKKYKTKKANGDFLVSKKAFSDILRRFNKIAFDEQLISFKNSKALKSILESDEKDSLSKKVEFIEKIFGKDKNDNKSSFAAQSTILMDIFYLSIVNNKLDNKYKSFVNRMNKRVVDSNTKLQKVTELDLIAAVNKVYCL